MKYERFVHPVRFLNLLPLSHVFGQFLGMFLPQLMGGTVIFQDALKPGEVIRTIRRERVSVLVAVPRMLQSLKEKVERDLEEKGALEDFQQQFRKRGREAFPASLVDLPAGASPVRMEILGIHLRRRRARSRDRRVLGTPRIRRHPGLWPDGDDLDHERESSFPFGQRINRQSSGGTRGETRAGR